MPDTAQRLGPQLLTSSSALLYTAPSSAVLRTIQVANNSGISRALTISIGVDGSGTRLVSSLTIPANGTYTWTGFLPLATSETIRANADANSALVMTAGLVEIS